MTTERLTIEPLAVAHAARLFAALDHPDVGRYIGGPDVTTPEALRSRIERLAEGPGPERSGERWWNFAVLLGDVVIGRLEATTYDGGDDPYGEVAYLFDPRHGGHGYATEATSWLIGHLAEHGVTELWAAIRHDNAASIRLIERLGFGIVDGEPWRELGSYDQGDDVVYLHR
jgi:RimJ/RimL family protein N-acetyltransferase